MAQEDKFDKFKKAAEKNEEEYNQTVKTLAQMEMENEELKNDVRQMGFMVEDLEQKLDS